MVFQSYEIESHILTVSRLQQPLQYVFRLNLRVKSCSRLYYYFALSLSQRIEYRMPWIWLLFLLLSSVVAASPPGVTHDERFFLETFQDDAQRIREEMEEEAKASVLQLKQKLLARKRHQERERRATFQRKYLQQNEQLQHHQHQLVKEQQNTLTDDQEIPISITNNMENTQDEMIIEKDDSTLLITNDDKQCDNIDMPFETTKDIDVVTTPQPLEHQQAEQQKRRRKVKKPRINIRKKKKKKSKQQTSTTDSSVLDQLFSDTNSQSKAKDAIVEALQNDSVITHQEWWGALRTGIALLVVLVLLTFAMKIMEQAAGI